MLWQTTAVQQLFACGPVSYLLDWLARSQLGRGHFAIYVRAVPPVPRRRGGLRGARRGDRGGRGAGLRRDGGDVVLRGGPHQAPRVAWDARARGALPGEDAEEAPGAGEVRRVGRGEGGPRGDVRLMLERGQRELKPIRRAYEAWVEAGLPLDWDRQAFEAERKMDSKKHLAK